MRARRARARGRRNIQAREARTQDRRDQRARGAHIQAPARPHRSDQARTPRSQPLASTHSRARRPRPPNTNHTQPRVTHLTRDTCQHPNTVLSRPLMPRARDVPLGEPTRSRDRVEPHAMRVRVQRRARACACQQCPTPLRTPYYIPLTYLAQCPTSSLCYRRLRGHAPVHPPLSAPMSTTKTTPLQEELRSTPPYPHSPYLPHPCPICHSLGHWQHSRCSSSTCDTLRDRQIGLRKRHLPVQQHHHHTLPYHPIPPATMANQKFNQKLQ